MDNRLWFFGCSFTNVEDSLTGTYFESYKSKLSRNTGLNYISNAKNGNANQHIIDDVYVSSSYTRHLDDIFIIQYSFFDRLGMRSDVKNRKFTSMCKTEIDDSCDWRDAKIIDFYNDWLKYFYSKAGSIVDFEKEVNLISNWLKSKDIKFLSIGFDESMDRFSNEFYENNNFVKFDETYSMYKKAIDSKLRIHDLNIQNGIVDNHLSEEGHIYLSDKILTKLKKLKYIKDERSIL